jgi:hypothetical protein
MNAHFLSPPCYMILQLKGLPADMEPVIAHKIREVIFRNLCSWIDDRRLLVEAQDKSQDQALAKPSEVGLHVCTDRFVYVDVCA